MKKVLFLLISIWLSQSLNAQWFYDDCSGGAANSAQPSPWVNTSTAANPTGIVNQGVTTVGQVGSAIWQNGWNGISGNTTTAGTSLGWSNTSGQTGNVSVTYTYTLALTGTAQITSLTFGVRSNTAANRNFSVSINSVNQPLSASTMADNNWLGVTCTPTTPINLTTGTITIRVSCTGQNGTTSGMIQRLDEMKIFGSVTPAPTCTNPTAFNLTGGGAYCTGGNGVAVGLAGSESDVTYQLIRGGSSVGSPVNGTGSAITFGNQTVAGSYTVLATRTTGGCTATMTGSQTVTVNANPSPTASSFTNVACNGGSNGSFIISASGGATPYQFNRGTGNQGSGTFSGLAAGSYVVTVTDANGCVGTTGVTITQPSALTVGVSSLTNIACNGGSNGSMTISASGGTSSYQFNRGAGNQGSGTFFGLAAGSYVVTVTDANGCQGTTGVTITQPAALIVGVSSFTNIACNGGSNGSMTISASGGTSSYQFNRGTGNQGSGTFFGLAAGSYVVTVTDANGCQGTRGVTITQPSALTVGVSSFTNIACNGGSNGSMTISASGGTPSYQFNRGTGNQPSGTFSGLAAGSYVVTLTDANGCQGTTGVTITQPSALTLTVSSSACGTGTASASGGTANYTYSWNAGTPTGGNVSLAAGTNTVTVTDANGCQANGSTSVAACNASVTFAVRIPSHLINVTAVDVTGSFVNAAGAGQDWNTGITLSDPDMDGVWTNAGLVSLPPSTAYQYKFRAYNSASPIWESVPNACQVGGNRGFTSAAGGAQVLSTVCFNQCSGTCPTYTPVTFSVHVPYTAYPALTSVDVTGNFMQAAVLGGDFSTGVVLTDPDMDGYYTNATPVYLSAGGSYQYKFRTYTPGQNWENVPGACQVGGNRGFTVASSAQTLLSVCFGECNASCVNPFSATAAGYDCANNGRIYNFSSLGNPAVTPASGSFAAGSHTVTLTNGAGYRGTLTFTSTGYTPATVTASAGAIACAGGESTVTVSAAGGVGPYTGTGTFQRTAGSQTFTVTDAAGCTSSTNINVTEPTALTATANGNAISCFGGNSRVTITAAGGTPSYTGTGSFFVNAGTYDFTVTDANGCTSVANYIVSEPNMVFVSLSAGTITNNGGTTTVTVTASGGTPAYSGEGVFTRSAGSQSFTVTDANGCVGTNSILLTEPGQLSAATQSGTIACFGGSTQVTVTGVDGTPPYTGTGVFTRSAGSQNFTVTDANGASVVITTFLTQPTQVVASAIAGSISCNGGSTNVTVSATGGTPGYTGEGVVVRAAGSRSFTVTDANGCPATTSINIAQPAVLSIAASTTSCETGSATVTGGTSPYTVEWTNGATGTNVTLATGTNRATVTDANGCSATSSNITVGSCTVPVTFAVRIPVSMTANVTAVDVTGSFVNAAGLGNNWNAGHSLTDPDMDGVWTSPAAIRLPFSTSYEYKFRAYRTDLGQVWESATGGCINGNGNRTMSVPANGSLNIGTVCWQRCTNACPTLVPVNFSVGIPSTMSGVTSVDVTGNWVFDAALGGNWNNALTLTDPDMDGVWTGPTVYVNAGVAYEYKFRSYTASTGPNWEGNIPSPCGNGSNRTFTAPASGTTNLTYCFGSCNTSCPSANVPVNFAATIPGTMTGVVAVDVTGNWIAAAGLGTNFSDGLTLTDPDMDGTWTSPNPVNITSSSTFEYKFRTYSSVGGQANWENIPNACATNGNRALTTPASGPSTFGPFCFGRCSANCAPPVMVSVTFSVSVPSTMLGVSSMDVTGDWVNEGGFGNNWSDGMTLTDPDMDGTWTNATPVLLPSGGNYLYKFRAYLGTSTPHWETLSGSCTAGGGNRPMVLPASGTYMAGNYCFETCNSSCASGTVPVTFSVAIPISLNGVTVVDVTGNWIAAAGLGANWSDGLSLTDPDMDGVWTNASPVQLPSGSSFEYKARYYNGFQNWENVPSACATNGNRAFSTPSSGPSNVGPFCVNTCNSSCLITFTATPSGVDCANGGQTFVFTASDGDVVTPASGTYAAGNQVVTLTHATGYSNTVSFTSTGYTPFTASISGNGSFCPSANSNLTASPSGLNYRWSTSAVTQSITVNTAAMFRVTVSDAAGCSSTASLQTTVSDAQAPVITCPANQTVNGTGTAYLPDYRSMVTANDNCATNVVLTQSPAAGTAYTATNTVNITITGNDGNGNMSTCTFDANITVNPGQVYTSGGDRTCNFTYLWATTLGVPSSQSGVVACYNVFGNNIGASANNDPINCGSLGDKGVWYYFRMPCGPAGASDTRVRISTNNAGTTLAGTSLGVYTVTSAGSCVGASHNLIACSGNSNVAGCSGPSVSANHGTLEFGPSDANGPLQNGGAYYVYVSGDNGTEGNFELTFEYIQNGAITVTAGMTPGQTEVTVPNNGQSGFRAQWRPMGAMGWATSPLTTGFSYTLPANSLMPGVNYEYRALYDACLSSGFMTMASPIVNFATTATVGTCAPVSGLSCNRMAGSVTATWGAVPAGTTGNITVALRNGSLNLGGRSLASTVTSTVFANVPTATSMQVQSLCGGAAYIATSNCTLNAASQQSVEPVSFEFNGISYEGIDFNDANWGLFGAQPEGEFTMSAENGQLVIRDANSATAGFDFELRPSVATDFTNVVISTQKTVDAHLSLSDMNGTLVSSQMLKGVQNGTVVTLETSELPAGLYIVSVRTEEGNVAKKLVVVK